MNICRICESKEIYTSLIESSNNIILNKLKAIADIQFDPNDCLPKHICEKCALTLEIAYKFKIQCEYTEQKLRRLLQTDYDHEIQNCTKSRRKRNAQDVANIVKIKEEQDKSVFCSTDENDGKKEEAATDTDEDMAKDQSSDEQNHFEIDIFESKLIKYDSMEEFVEVPEEQINNATDPIENVDEFEECIDDNQMGARDVVGNQSQDRIEHSSVPIENGNDKSATSRNKLENKKLNSKKKHYTCVACNEIFDCFRKFVEHKKSHGKQRHRCPDCGKWFSRRCNMINHQTVIHKNEQKFLCNLCTRCYVNQGSLDRHIRDVHNKEKNFTCNECDKCFSQASSLKSHLLIHTDDKPYQCDICHKCFKSNIDLNKHKKYHLPSYKQMQKQRQRKIYLKKSKTPKRTFICEFCGKIIPFANHQRHRHMHTGEKPYECFECKRRFSSHSTLRQHIFTHSSERPHKCNQCHLTFRQIGHLKSHQLVHSGVKPYKCSICAKSFAYRNSIIVHMRFHTGEKPYHCTYCRQQFSEKNNLKRHIKSIHMKTGVKKNISVNTIPVSACSTGV